ncbi:MAG TPA: glucose-1-phosphate adenylyltransferase [Ilumatobacter sp.]|nr:glucose-1-phosphate adenylyltransferase [Ilumatobacter sp.]
MSPPAMRTNQARVLSMVLAGGEGKRLAPLTTDRAKPAVPFGGHYRLIDFVLSNLVNGGYRKIVVLTQYKSHSLDVHLSRTWRLSSMLGNYVVGIPAQMRRGPHWYSGSADAIFQNLNLIEDERPTHVMVFGADHIYRMDPRPMLKQHLQTGAGLTVAGIRVPRASATEFGVIDVEGAEPGGTKIRGFLEKPADPPGLPDSPDETLASMGNYLFDADLLRTLVTDDAARTASKHDMGGDIVPAVVAAGDAHVYDFSQNIVEGETDRDHAYWRDVGTLDSYFDAHMDLVAPEPVFNLYNYDWPIYTAAGVLPPAKLTEDHGRPAEVLNSVVCNGAIVSGANVNEAVLSPRVMVGGGADIARAVLLDGVEVGAGAVLHNVILDKNVHVPPGLQIGVDRDADVDRFATRDNCRVTDSGIVVVGKGDDLTDLA